MHDPIVIVSAVRTPMGAFQGDLKGLTAPQLGAAAIRAAVERAGIAPDAVDEVLFGCVLPAGLGQAQGDAQADAAGGAGDQGGLAVQCRHINLTQCRWRRKYQSPRTPRGS